jgi:hypothetical protein
LEKNKNVAVVSIHPTPKDVVFAVLLWGRLVPPILEIVRGLVSSALLSCVLSSSLLKAYNVLANRENGSITAFQRYFIGSQIECFLG